MANPSVSIPDDLLNELDEIILAKKFHGELETNTSRSEVIQQLVREYVEENRDILDE